MQRLFFGFLLFILSFKAFAGPPELKVFVYGKQVYHNQSKVIAQVKVKGRYYSILNKNRQIIMHHDVTYNDIDQFRFIINTDTIVFTSKMMLEHLYSIPGKNQIDEYYAIFNELKAWKISIENPQPFYSKINKDAMPCKKIIELYSNYKIYSFETNTLKYYSVRKR